MVTTEQEVADIFGKYGNVVKVYKEMAPQYKEHPRYLGGTFIVCIVQRNEEEVSAIPDFQDVNIRGRTYSMLSVVLGLPPRCHRCKVRGHLARNCVACRYCGSAGHTSEEHSVHNARRRTFTEVAGGNRGTQEYEVEEGSMDEGQETPLQQPDIDCQPGPMTQLLQESQGEGDVTVGDGGEEKDGGILSVRRREGKGIMRGMVGKRRLGIREMGREGWGQSGKSPRRRGGGRGMGIGMGKGLAGPVLVPGGGTGGGLEVPVPLLDGPLGTGGEGGRRAASSSLSQGSQGEGLISWGLGVTL